MLQRFIKDERGQTFLEYGMVISIVSIAVISGLLMFKGGLDAYMTKLTDFVTSVL